MSWTQQAQDKVIMCYAVINKVMNLRVSQREGN